MQLTPCVDYVRPFDRSEYLDEPSADQSAILIRALAHHVAAFYASESEMSAEAIVLDFFESQTDRLAHPAISDEERARIAAVFPNIDIS